MKYNESNLQISCVKWFRLQFPTLLLFAIPNGGARSAITGAILKKEGVVAGVPDLFLAHASNEHHGLFIEMKTITGVVRCTQKEVIQKLSEEGYKCEVCRCFEDFKKIITDYLQSKKK